MIRFSRFLIEGGNVKVGEHQSEPLRVTEHNREKHQHDIHNALSQIHDSFHAKHGEHLFGPDKKALNNRSIFTGSSKNLMQNKISHAEFAKYKPNVGDVDIQVPKHLTSKVKEHLATGSKFGKYTVLGKASHGTTISAVMQHDNGQKHQFDFSPGHYVNGSPTRGSSFLHGSSWADTKRGIKGAHRQMLINAAGGEHHKFSSIHGLKPREDAANKSGISDPKKIAHTLFGPKADHKKIQSFLGVTSLIKKHIPASEHQAIYDKFKKSADSKKKDIDPKKAVAHLKKHLGTHDSMNEETEVTHHASVIPLVGFSPFSHMGHAKDLGDAMKKLPGKKHIGISHKDEGFSDEEKSSILNRQWRQKDLQHHHVASAGVTVSNAYHSLPAGKKVLHMLVGHDRKDMVHKLKSSLEAGKIKEMNGKHWDEIHIHHPENTNRDHGMSGTKMRTAASKGDIPTFSKHLGPHFSTAETLKIYDKVRSNIASGKIPLKR